ncbi:DUF3991 and toprim domain-containing protein [Paenibacillus antibioticophila]|uniref:DUF3991 and toprim domain-containing protein n=1 Tax=Paenibacillus antibioticophila TaxID=1274374 RepID=UPI0005C9AE0B|nr:DUF3991 and toprim domain-containing protein [Paenibacillus antibioticophila]
MAQNHLFTKEQIRTANLINLIEFAKSQGYVLENGGRRAYHAMQSGGLYFFKDSNRYFHFSSNTHGGTIDFAMHFCRMTFKEAVAYLLELELPQKVVASSTKERGQLILPDKAPNYRRVEWYLTQVRGIAPEIVSLLMHEKKLYQQDKTGNCVFVGYDQGVARYCSIRGTTPNKPFKQDREYSDKSYPFHLCRYPDSKRIYVCESPIDAMSRATIAKINGQDWEASHYISLGCLSDQALERFLERNPIKEIVLCLDNDANATYSNDSPAPNWGQEAASKYARKYLDLGYSTIKETPNNKDVNEDLYKLRFFETIQHHETINNEHVEQ